MKLNFVLRIFFMGVFTLLFQYVILPSTVISANSPLRDPSIFKQFDSIHSRIQLLPHSSDPCQLSQDGQLTDNSWYKYDDSYLSFLYPAYPNMKVDVSGNSESFVEELFTRTYHVNFQNNIFCRLQMRNVPVFEDEVDCCGLLQSVYEKYFLHNRMLYRISFLEDGRIGKIQILCDNFHVALHPPALPCNNVRKVIVPLTSITQELYLKFALGIQLKNCSYSQQDIRVMIYERYGFKGLLGLLEKGMSKQNIISVLGKPQYEKDDILTYIAHEKRWGFTVRLHLEHDALMEFRPHWFTSRRLPPQRGTIDWMSETLGLQTIVEKDREYHLAPLNKNDIPYIFDRFVELAFQVSAEDWNRLCSVIYELYERGYHDRRVLPIIRERFLEPGPDFDAALEILYIHDREYSGNLLIKKAEQFLEIAKQVANDNHEYAETLIVGHRTFRDLLSYIESIHPKEFERLVLMGMDHPHELIQMEAYHFWPNLSARDALPRLEKGLTHPSPWVRQESARGFIKCYGAAEHLPLLRQQLEQESDEEVRKLLQIASKRLSSRTPQ